MAKIIKERTREVSIEYYREFLHKTNGQEYSFPCDEKGEVSNLPEVAKPNYNNCVAKSVGEDAEFLDKGIVKYEKPYTEPAIIRCDCGEEFYLENQYLGACECPKCSQWYNLFGQRLKPPHLWED